MPKASALSISKLTPHNVSLASLVGVEIVIRQIGLCLCVILKSLRSLVGQIPLRTGVHSRHLHEPPAQFFSPRLFILGHRQPRHLAHQILP